MGSVLIWILVLLLMFVPVNNKVSKYRIVGSLTYDFISVFKHISVMYRTPDLQELGFVHNPLNHVAVQRVPDRAKANPLFLLRSDGNWYCISRGYRSIRTTLNTYNQVIGKLFGSRLSKVLNNHSDRSASLKWNWRSTESDSVIGIDNNKPLHQNISSLRQEQRFVGNIGLTFYSAHRSPQKPYLERTYYNQQEVKTPIRPMVVPRNL